MAKILRQPPVRLAAAGHRRKHIGHGSESLIPDDAVSLPHVILLPNASLVMLLACGRLAQGGSKVEVVLGDVK